MKVLHIAKLFNSKQTERGYSFGDNESNVSLVMVLLIKHALVDFSVKFLPATLSNVPHYDFFYNLVIFSNFKVKFKVFRKSSIRFCEYMPS